MNEKALSKLKREELLKLLYEQEKRIEDLEASNKKLEEELNDKRIRISKVGSIADASLMLTNVFDEAQKAVDIYLQNVQAIVKEKQTDKYVFPANKQQVHQKQAAPQQKQTKAGQQRSAYLGRHSRSGEEKK